MGLWLACKPHESIYLRGFSHCTISIIATSQLFGNRRDQTYAQLADCLKMTLSEWVVPHESVHSWGNKEWLCVVPCPRYACQEVVT
jgi:hypothetical protein